MKLLLALAFLALFCVDYYLVYNHTVAKSIHLTEKQRAHILSIKASVTLFFISIYFNYKFLQCGLNVDEYSVNLSDNDNFIVKLGVLNLMSYLIMDCYVGYKKYHKYMCSLQGYFHHIVYIVLSTFALYLEVPSFYFLFMIEELPTILLGTGNYNKRLRQDNIFGLTFFLTRIVYHGYLVWKFSFNTLFLTLGLMSFTLHSYWFKNWFTKYVLKRNKPKETKIN